MLFQASVFACCTQPEPPSRGQSLKKLRLAKNSRHLSSRKNDEKPHDLCLDHVGNVHRHLLNLSVIIFLNVLHGSHIIVGHEVDGHTFAAKTTTATNAVQIIFHVL